MHSIGRYTVLKRLGGGGFGEVFLARDERIERDLAIKVFKPRDENLIALATSSPEEGVAFLRARFLKEARILAELEDCPYVVNVLDFGELEDGSPYYVMPWLPRNLVEQIGKDIFEVQALADLPDKERPRSLEPARAMTIVEQLLTGLAEAHGKGLIHRDIKPANVMFTESGQVRLVDFGIAKAPDGEHSTVSQLGIGSRNYMAPEQREGAKHVDARADVYALGALAYRILTGRLPQGRYADPDVHCPGLPAALNDLILQCLAENRSDRPGDAATLLKQWQRASAQDSTANLASETATWVTGGESRLKAELEPLRQQITRLLLQHGKVPEQERPHLEAMATSAGLDRAGLEALIAECELQNRTAIKPRRNKASNKPTRDATPGDTGNRSRSSGARLARAATVILILAAMLGAGGWWYLQMQDEQLAWHRAQNQNTIEGYQAHLNAWPDGSYSDRAQNRITAILDARKQAEAELTEQHQNLIGRVQAYLNGLGYPTPRHGKLDKRTEGNIRIFERSRGLVETGAADQVVLKQLQAEYQRKDRALWAQTKNVDTPNAYRAYLSSQNLGEYVDNARERLKELDSKAWQMARQSHSVAAYAAYGQAFPDGEHADRVEAMQAQAAWDQATAVNSVESYEAYLAGQPDGAYRAEAKRRLVPLLARKRLVTAIQQELKRLGYAVDRADGVPGPETRVAIEGFQWRIGQAQNGEATQALLAALRQTELEPGDLFQDCANCPEMVVIPAAAATGVRDDKPAQDMAIARPFALGRYELTWAEYGACIDAGACPELDDEGWGRGNRPVINVSWNDIMAHYIPWLSRSTGESYRLPTEAEWQHAARAGAQTRYSWGNTIGNNNANCAGCGSPWDDKKTAPVGSFRPNAFGLYDMHGNVSEWLADCAPEDPAGLPATDQPVADVDCDRRMYRGGAWDFGPKDLRSAHSSGRDFRYNTRGIRLARDL